MSSLIRRITIRAMEKASVPKIIVGKDSEGDPIFAWPLTLAKINQPIRSKRKPVKRDHRILANRIKPRVDVTASVKPKRDPRPKPVAGPVGDPRPKYHGQYVGMTGTHVSHNHAREILRRTTAPGSEARRGNITPSALA